MSYLLQHLHSGWAVDKAILGEEERLVVIRFGHDWDETCMHMDEVLASVAEKIKNYAVTYLVDITEDMGAEDDDSVFDQFAIFLIPNDINTLSSSSAPKSS
ncbi:unnamed protein product [Ilex paraguariensis]|uniref:Thioredoxin-like protein 4A n=1 Tax=Ilex paraguariensis TaxID=185542 RepID=A0ABC8UTM8_9AQUA